MVVSVIGFLALAAFILTLLSAAGYRPPLWVAVLLLSLIELLRLLPLGR